LFADIIKQSVPISSLDNFLQML